VAIVDARVVLCNLLKGSERAADTALEPLGAIARRTGSREDWKSSTFCCSGAGLAYGLVHAAVVRGTFSLGIVVMIREEYASQTRSNVTDPLNQHRLGAPRPDKPTDDMLRTSTDAPAKTNAWVTSAAVQDIP